MIAILKAVELTLFAPSVVDVIFGRAYPIHLRSSYLRWSMMLAQLNSLFKRNAVLEMLKMTWEPASGIQRRRRRIAIVLLSRSPNCDSVSEDSGEAERSATAPWCETNWEVCVEMHHSRMISTKPGIQNNRGVTRKRSQTHWPSASRFKIPGFTSASSPQTTGLGTIRWQDKI